MIKAPVVALCVAIAAATFVPAHAQTWPARRPGLWEAQYGGTGTNVPSLEDELAKMPPAQRARMEQYLKQQGRGIGSAPNTMTRRFCLTPQDAADRGEAMLARLQRTSDCQQKELVFTASGMRFRAACRAEDGTVGEVEGRLHDITPESYAAEWTANYGGTQMRMQQTARWLASDCGTLK